MARQSGPLADVVSGCDDFELRRGLLGALHSEPCGSYGDNPAAGSAGAVHAISPVLHGMSISASSRRYPSGAHRDRWAALFQATIHTESA